jgi:REP element-mobilizing transposase RayT
MIDIDKYVIMPNHIHILLVLKPNESGSSRTPIPTAQNSIVSRLVSTFKRFCNKEYGENIWQSHFHDHIIRNQDDYDEIAKYIRDNPKRWLYDELYVEE